MPKRPIAADDLLKLQFVGDPQMSPDGARVLFSRKTVSERGDYQTHLWTVPAGGGKPVQWTHGEKSAGGGRWSPDGETIAFVADRAGDGPQVFLLPAGGGEARQATTLPQGALGELRWSPDSKKLVFPFRETGEAFTKKAAKRREADGGATPPVEIDDVWYRLDGDGTFGNARFKLWLLEVESGEARELYAGDAMGNCEAAWAPDSSELAVVHSAKARPFHGPPDDQVYRVGLDGKARRLPGLPSGSKGAPAWSPSGARIAYIGETSADDPWGVRNRRLYVVAAEGGEPTMLAADTDYDLTVGTLGDTKEASDVALCLWKPDESGLYVQVGKHGENQLGLAGLDGSFRLLTEGNHSLGFGSMDAKGGKLAAIYTDPVVPPEVAVLELGGPAPIAPKLVTSFNASLVEELALVAPEEFWIESTDGVKVHAWMLVPPGKGARPGVLEVHGGPHAQYGWTFFHELQLLAANGYVVVYGNPRGSKGYGEAFCAAIKGDWGNKDWDDVQAITEWMAKRPEIDPTRIGIMGGSYGGYMTNWAIGHSKAYKAAITDRCVSNLVSMAGSSDFPVNDGAYFGGVAWGALDDIAPLWRQSPLAYFEGVSTPTLVIHSEGDLRCNIEQGEQVFHALQMQNVPSRFVRYPRETSHGMSRGGPPELRLHRLGEIVNWWAKYL